MNLVDWDRQVRRKYRNDDVEGWERRDAFEAWVRGRVAIQAVKLLIAHQANVQAADKNGLTPLHLAAYCGPGEVVELLISEGADMDARTARADRVERFGFRYFDGSYVLNAGATPLHGGVVGEDFNVIDVLIARGAAVNATDESGRTPLHYATERKNAQVAEFLVAKGADVNAEDESGATPLVGALHRGDVVMAERLIAAGAKRVSMRDHPLKEYDGRSWRHQSLLHRALDRGHQVVWTRERGGHVDVNALAEGGSQREWIELLLENGADPNERDQRGNTPLHVAILLGNEGLARLLLVHDADVNARNHRQSSPLHYAASDGREVMVSLLLAEGAVVSASDHDGDTPLHGAALHGHVKAVELLLAHGADASLKNSRGRTPLDEAVRRGHQDVIQVLKAHQVAKPGLPGEREK